MDQEHTDFEGNSWVDVENEEFIHDVALGSSDGNYSGYGVSSGKPAVLLHRNAYIRYD